MKEDAYNNRDHVQLLKCSDCGFVYSKVVSIDYQDYGRKAAAQKREKLINKSAKQGIPQLVEEITGKTGIARGRVLDFGCGVGLMAREFARLGYDINVIEQSQAYRDLLSSENMAAFESFAEINDYKGSFDLVIIKDVLEHLENPLETVQKLVSFIKPGGFLYLRVPNRYAYPFHWAVDTKGHINHFSPSILKKILDDAGLELHDYISLYDVSSVAGKIYNSLFWQLRNLLPLYHQISLLYKKPDIPSVA